MSGSLATMSPTVSLKVETEFAHNIQPLTSQTMWPQDYIPAQPAQSYMPLEPTPNFYSAMQSMISPQQQLPNPFSGIPGMPAPLPNWQPLDALFPESLDSLKSELAYRTPAPQKYSVAPLQPLSPQIEMPMSLACGELNTGAQRWGSQPTAPPRALQISADMTSQHNADQSAMSMLQNVDQIYQTPAPAPPKVNNRKRSREYMERRKAKILYDPVYNRTVAVAYACSQCHRAKKKCVGGGIGKSCLSCTKKGCECKPRTDKRAHNSRQQPTRRPRMGPSARNSILKRVIKKRADKFIRLPASILHRSIHTPYRVEE